VPTTDGQRVLRQLPPPSIPRGSTRSMGHALSLATTSSSGDVPLRFAESGTPPPTKEEFMARKKPSPKRTAPCKAPDCSRSAYARSYCQTHHRQFLANGRTTPIHPYRTRRSDTVKLSGLRLSKSCAGKLTTYAQKHGLSLGAAIAGVLERWNSRRSS